MSWNADENKPLWYKFLDKILCNIASKKTWVFFVASAIFIWTTKLPWWGWLILAAAYAGFNAVLDIIFAWFKGKNGVKK